MAAKMTVWNDQLAENYRKLGENPISKLLDFTLLHYMGNVEGKSVLDIGCGEGRFCRLVKSKGASYVLGVDVCPGMINAARMNETSGRSCDYELGNAYKLGKIGQFDFVTSIGLLPYTETIPELTTMASNFYEHLKAGGKFVSIGVNCLQHSGFHGTIAHYDLGRVTVLPVKDEARRLKYVGRSSKSEGDIFTATLFYFEPHVYFRVFHKVGFREFDMFPIVLSPENINGQVEGYWDVYMTTPLHLCYAAEK